MTKSPFSSAGGGDADTNPHNMAAGSGNATGNTMPKVPETSRQKRVAKVAGK